MREPVESFHIDVIRQTFWIYSWNTLHFYRLFVTFSVSNETTIEKQNQQQQQQQQKTYPHPLTKKLYIILHKYSVYIVTFDSTA